MNRYIITFGKGLKTTVTAYTEEDAIHKFHQLFPTYRFSRIERDF